MAMNEESAGINDPLDQSAVATFSAARAEGRVHAVFEKFADRAIREKQEAGEEMRGAMPHASPTEAERAELREAFIELQAYELVKEKRQRDFAFYLKHKRYPTISDQASQSASDAKFEITKLITKVIFYLAVTAASVKVLFG